MLLPQLVAGSAPIGGSTTMFPVTKQPLPTGQTTGNMDIIKDKLKFAWIYQNINHIAVMIRLYMWIYIM